MSMRSDWVAIIREASDDVVRQPLWEWPPVARSAVLTERNRRGFNSSDPEPIGDPEYT